VFDYVEIFILQDGIKVGIIDGELYITQERNLPVPKVHTKIRLMGTVRVLGQFCSFEELFDSMPVLDLIIKNKNKEIKYKELYIESVGLIYNYKNITIIDNCNFRSW
jgi:hypothetical protein